MSKKAIDKQDWSLGSFRGYAAGFGLSLALTGVSFYLVDRHIDSRRLLFSDDFIIIALAVLAVIQLLIQMVFFLHLDRESKPRWNFTALTFAATVVLILVFGSIWIMNSLDSRHSGYGQTHDGHELKSPTQTEQYIIDDEGIKR